MRRRSGLLIGVAWTILACGLPLVSSGATSSVSVSVPSVAVGTVTITATTSATRSLARLDVYVDAGWVASCTKSPCAYAWDTRTVANGAHVVWAVRVATDGKTESSPQVPVTVDNDWIPPSVSLSAPSSGSGVVTVGVSAADASGVASVELLVDSQVTASLAGASLMYQLDTTVLGGGNHTLQGRAWDVWGNGGESPVSVLEVQAPPPPPPPVGGCAEAEDYQDPTYGAQVRRLKRVDGSEHGIYYHRNPWNADSSAMVAVYTDAAGGNWQVVLLDAEGCYLKTLFPISQYDWRLVWDRADRDILYTWRAKTLYRFDVTTGVATAVKTFGSQLKPNGPSINQDNSKMLVVTAEPVPVPRVTAEPVPVLRVLRMSDWAELNAFTITNGSAVFNGTADCRTDWEDERFTGYDDQIFAACANSDWTTRVVRIFNGDGTLYHEFNGRQYRGEHSDFSPDGRWAYFELYTGEPLRIHVVNVDGTNDTVVFSATWAEAEWLQNLHISWPDRDPDTFFVSFFPSAQKPAPADAVLVDQLMVVRTSATALNLARTYGSGTPFWTQGLASPNADGTLVSFSSNHCPVAALPCLETLDLHIVKVPPPGGPQ